MKNFSRILLILLGIFLIWKFIFQRDTDEQATEPAPTEQQQLVPASDNTPDSQPAPAPTPPPAPKKAVSPQLELEKYADLSGGIIILDSRNRIDLAPASMAIASYIESQELAYSAANMADCSGIFHRVLREFKNLYPQQSYPRYGKYRDSRSLANWYKRHGQLTEVEAGQELAAAEAIRPGMALFYGKKAITHVGMVVAVQRNEAGQVVQYDLFHGRNPNYTASITSFHELAPSNPEYPPYGVGDDPLRAFAPIVF